MLDVPPQALPWKATSSESADDIKSWQTNVLGTKAVFRFLEALLLIDDPVRAAVVRDGGLDAAMQRIR